jgi:hypothetical protein
MLSESASIWFAQFGPEPIRGTLKVRYVVAPSARVRWEGGGGVRGWPTGTWRPARGGCPAAPAH